MNSLYSACIYCLQIVSILELGQASLFTGNNHLSAEDLSDEEFRDTFGVEHTANKHVPEHTVFIPRVAYANSLDKLSSASVLLDGHWLNLPLKSSFSALFGESVTHVERYANHSRLTVDRPSALVNNCHYHSKHYKHVTAAISNCDAHLKGTVITEEGVYVIQPVPERHRRRLKRAVSDNLNDQFEPHVIYKRDAFTSNKNFCDLEEVENEIDDDISIEDAFVLRSESDDQWNNPKRANLTVELALFVDEKLWEKFEQKYSTQADSNLRDFATTVFNNIQIMYHHPSITPSVTFKIVRYEIFKSQPTRLAGPYHNEGQAQEYLDNFCKYQQRMRGNNWDHSFLLTGYDLHRSGSNSISGIARLHGMCDEWNACTLAEGMDFTSVFIGTHEFGHGVGMRHDEPYCQSSYIMSSSLGPGKVSWSSCSMKDFHKFVDRLDRRNKNCMRKLSADQEKLAMEPSDMPGVRYSGDQQCRIMHGTGFKQVNPRQDSADGPCTMMWCGQGSGRIITSHPALEGTNCGYNRWCVQGKCLQKSNTWRQEPASPATWSEWSRVSCSSCSCPSLNGAIALLTSRRKCSSSFDCRGSPVRGIVCNNKCHGTETISDYMATVCAGHRANKKDFELTGEGSQLTRNPNRACKVFCNIDSKTSNRRRTYRLFGDILPDGAPCGRDSYCAEGECLPLACDGQVLLDNNSRCPAESDKCARNSVRVRFSETSQKESADLWSSWAEWSPCSVTCGYGTVYRRRSCSTNNCLGPKEETKDCNLNACSYKGDWEQWQSWTTCTASCGGGQRWRYRRCDKAQCDGSNSQQETCSQNYCAWSQWTRCSRECGGGVQKRARDCYNGQCPGESREERQCNTQSCKAWSVWSAWSLCSVTCGRGTETRLRSCSGYLCPTSGIQEDRRACSLAYCEWEGWTPCSRTCGEGTRTRFRTCPGGGCTDQLNPLKTNQDNGQCIVRKCEVDNKLDPHHNDHPKEDKHKNAVQASWTSWGDWTDCSVSCGEGMKARYRKCKDVNGRGSYDCFGADYLSDFCSGDKCNSVAAQWSVWAAWSHCSKTCNGYGVKTRWRKCEGGSDCSGAKDEEVSCGSYKACPRQNNRRYRNRAFSKAFWSEWSLWGSCSVTCGEGSRSRSRNCFKGQCSGDAIEREACRESKTCPEWSTWGVWSTCSRTCGGGIRQRTRACNDIYGCSGKNYDEDMCASWPCYVGSDLNSFNNLDPTWKQWTQWNECTASCDGGTRSRTRSCNGLGCFGRKFQKEKCNKDPCAKWGGWGLWSECSVTCGSGTRRRLRNCYGWGNCYGDKEQLEPCFTGLCFRS